jgi:hypothetical protein
MIAWLRDEPVSWDGYFAREKFRAEKAGRHLGEYAAPSLLLSGVWIGKQGLRVGGIAIVASGLPYNVVTDANNSGDTGATRHFYFALTPTPEAVITCCT